MPAEPTVFIVDDDPAVQDVLRNLVGSIGLQAETYGAAHELLAASRDERPGCLVLDIRLPGLSGFSLLEQLAAQQRSLPTVVITGHGHVPMAVRAMKLGAVDFLEKPFKPQALLDSVQRAIDHDERQRRHRTRRLAVGARVKRLTPRERQVMDLVVRGLANKQIASELGCSGKTIELHRAHMMKKMEAQSVADLVRQVLSVRTGFEETPNHETGSPDDSPRG